MNDMAPHLDGLSRKGGNQKASLALAAGKMETFEWDIVTNALDCDRANMALFGLADDVPSVDAIFAAIHPDDRERVTGEVQQTLENDEDYDTSFRVVHPNGDIVWLGGRGRVMDRDADGKALRMLGVNWDMTHVKDQEERLTYLAHEMNHRVNNAFALMESMLVLGRDTAEDLNGFADLLCAQIHALADSHQLASDFFLHRSANLETVRFEEILNKVLRVWMNGPLRDRISLDVQPGLCVLSKDITPFAMILYELATNAAKHSVLGRNTGTLSIRVFYSGASRAVLEWTEVVDDAGAPRTPPSDMATGSGMGALLVEHCMHKMNAKNITKRLDETGFKYAMSFRIGPNDPANCPGQCEACAISPESCGSP